MQAEEEPVEGKLVKEGRGREKGVTNTEKDKRVLLGKLEHGMTGSSRERAKGME